MFDDCKTCREYSDLSRRRFLGVSGSLFAAAAVPAWIPRVVLADSHDSDRDVLVSIFLRGGGDALTLCVPHGENAYYDLRPSLAIPRPDDASNARAIDLDGFFGIPQTMAPLLDAYQAGDLLMVHACGQKHPTRSHFEAMYHMEVGMGDPPSSLFTGWLGRHLAMTAPTRADGVLRAVALGYGVPRSLVGAPSTLPVEDPSNFGFQGDAETAELRREALELMYRAADGPFGVSARNTFAAVELLREIDFANYQPSGGATYAEDEFGTALSSAAALIKAEVGVEALAIDLGGWDTHENQGAIDGFMAQLTAGFASNLAAFHADLEASDQRRVTVVVMSEFGRNAFENGSAGTDHGHGGMMMLLGDAVAGGRVLTEWPGLEYEQLYEGQDLHVTIDYRDVLAEVLERRLNNRDAAAVFSDPAFKPTHRGVVS